MDWRSLLDTRPIVVAVAGSNGAGKSTFFHAHLAATGLRFVNADDLAVEMGIGACEAAELATTRFRRPLAPAAAALRRPYLRPAPLITIS